MPEFSQIFETPRAQEQELPLGQGPQCAAEEVKAGAVTKLLWLAVWLFAFVANPASAHEAKVNVTATCECEYSVTATGNTDPYAVARIDFSFTVASDGNNYPVRNHVETVADPSGWFAVTVSSSLPGGCKRSVSFSGGTANLTIHGIRVSTFPITVPSTLSCQRGSGNLACIRRRFQSSSSSWSVRSAVRSSPHAALW